MFVISDILVVGLPRKPLSKYVHNVFSYQGASQRISLSDNAVEIFFKFQIVTATWLQSTSWYHKPLSTVNNRYICRGSSVVTFDDVSFISRHAFSIYLSVSRLKIPSLIFYYLRYIPFHFLITPKFLLLLLFFLFFLLKIYFLRCKTRNG